MRLLSLPPLLLLLLLAHAAVSLPLAETAPFAAVRAALGAHADDVLSQSANAAPLPQDVDPWDAFTQFLNGIFTCTNTTARTVTVVHKNQVRREPSLR